MSEPDQIRLLLELTAKVDGMSAQLTRVLKKPQSRELISATRVDEMFRLRKGTAYKACAAGLIPCATRSTRGARTYLIKVEDAEAQWGAR